MFEGGPVQSGSVLALADFCEPAQSAALAFGSVGYLRGDEDPAALVGDVTAVRVFSGYSGWGPGQLEMELEQEAWITLPAVVEDVFGDPDGLWGRALARKGGRYKLVAQMPDDPSLN